MNQIQELQDRISRWQDRQFPDGTVASKFKHLTKELDEVVSDQRNKSEWADVLILYLGAAALEDFTVEEIVMAAMAKMDINERRKWASPDEHGVCKHIE